MLKEDEEGLVKSKTGRKAPMQKHASTALKYAGHTYIYTHRKKTKQNSFFSPSPSIKDDLIALLIQRPR